MSNKTTPQMWLRLAPDSPAELSPEAERELVETLAALLLQVATAGAVETGESDDDTEDR